MKEIQVNKIVYYHKGQKIEIPIHLRRVCITGDFQNPVDININAVCKNKTECKLWKNLIDYLSPI